MRKIVLITGATGASKMMNLLFTFSLAKRLEGTGVMAKVYHPGLMKSDLINEMPGLIRLLINLFPSSPHKAARMLCRIALDSENSEMKFQHKFNGDVIKSSDYAYDHEIQDKL